MGRVGSGQEVCRLEWDDVNGSHRGPDEPRARLERSPATSVGWPARDASDHAADVVVADRLAVFTHGDDGVVDLREFRVVGEREAELLGVLADGADGPSDGRARADRLTDRRRLVRRSRRCASPSACRPGGCWLRRAKARCPTMACSTARVPMSAGTATGWFSKSSGELRPCPWQRRSDGRAQNHEFFERGVAGAFADAVDGAFDLADTALERRARLLATARPRSFVTVSAEDRFVGVGQFAE